MRFWKSLLLVVLVAAPAWAEVKLPAIISDHMVLQAGQPIVLWGWCDAGETVTVSLNGDQATPRRTSPIPLRSFPSSGTSKKR